MNGRRTRSWRRTLLPALLLIPLATACGDDGASTPGPVDSRAPEGSAVTVELGDRPFKLHVPESYDPAQPAPLVIGLHGYTSNSTEMESYFNLTAESDQRGFLYAMPDGTRDRRGNQFWNATNACCDMDGNGVDDSAYLSQLIETVKQSYAVDGDRVFLVGHSNGGYMSHRMACDHADQITAIASLAGIVWQDPSRCNPSRPVSVLQIHGTADATVNYNGGSFGGGNGYPGAEETVQQWREHNGCTGVADTTAPPLDLDTSLSGAETVVTRYADGCGDGSRVELWSIEGGGHVPAISAAFTPAVLDFFYSLQA
jgi:polyhydroxybutyrate depolymerase